MAIPQWLQNMGWAWSHIPALDKRTYAAGSVPVASASGTVVGALENMQEPFGNKADGALYGVEFDGSNDLINFGTNPVSYAGNKLTIAQWFKVVAPNTFNPQRALFSARTASDNGILMGFESGTFAMRFRNGDATTLLFTPLNINLQGTIVCAACVFDTDASPTQKIYVNGQFLTQTVTGTLPNTLNIPITAVHRVGMLDAANIPFLGFVYNTSVFLKGLSQSEVQTLCQKGPTLGLTGTISGPNGEYMDLKDKRRAGGGLGLKTLGLN
jgi:hypothetical protein